jgi:arginase
VPVERVVLIGERDFDAAERTRLAASGIPIVAPEAVRAHGAVAAVATPLDALRDRVDAVYLHVDLDVLDPSEGQANPLAVPGGLSLDEVCAVIRAVGERFTIAAAGITSYDPALDGDGRVAAAGVRIAREIAAAAPR